MEIHRLQFYVHYLDMLSPFFFCLFYIKINRKIIKAKIQLFIGKNKRKIMVASGFSKQATGVFIHSLMML